MPDSPTTPAIQPGSPNKGSEKDKNVKHGRRADAPAAGADATAGSSKPKPTSGWGEESQVKKPLFDNEANPDVQVVETSGGEDVQQELAKPIDEEELQREVAAAPTEYHSAMPKLAELEAEGTSGAAAKWVPMRQDTGEIDLSCLTSVLVGQLDDEDVPWVPDVMLVQLTSELADQAGGEGEEEENEDEASIGGGGLAGPAGALGGSTAPAAGANQLGLSKRDLGASSGAAGGSSNSPTAAGDTSVSAAGRRRGVA